MEDQRSNSQNPETRRMKAPREFDGGRVDAAVREAMRNVRILRKRMGMSLVGWKDGKIVKIPPEEIQIDDPPSADAT